MTARPTPTQRLAVEILDCPDCTITAGTTHLCGWHENLVAATAAVRTALHTDKDNH